MKIKLADSVMCVPVDFEKLAREAPCLWMTTREIAELLGVETSRNYLNSLGQCLGKRLVQVEVKMGKDKMRLWRTAELEHPEPIHREDVRKAREVAGLVAG